MFRYPNAPQEVRVGLRFFVLIFVWLAVGEIASIVVARPRWAGFPASTWWPTLLPDHPAYTVISEIVDVGGVVFAVAYMFLWIRRWRRSRGISRGLAVPVAVAASVTCGITIVELIAAALVVSHQTMERIYAVEAYLQIAVPVAFLISVLRRRFARTRIVELLLHLRGPARASAVTDALRIVFEDSDLEVIDCVPGSRAADDGSCADRRGDGRLRLPITSSSGERLALILADPSLSANDEMVQAAVAASSFALENARLDTALREQLQEVRESRLRIIEAGVTERRKLERDLHDGTQQRLLALKIMLAAAEADLADDGAQAALSRIRAELGHVLDELRDLAHGIHPTALSQVGLEQAVRSMAERYTVPIDVSLPPERFGDAAELTAYYLIAESITNAVKHAQATRITIRGAKSGGYLQVTVIDDGRGGASAAAGTGIRGLIDRVRGIGGELELESPAGLGTQIRAHLPCA